MRLIIFICMFIGLSSCTTVSESSADLMTQANQPLEVSEVHQSQKSDTQSLPYKWHDGTKGGLYGIGDDWSIELSPAQYGHETQTYLSGEQAQQQALKLIPAEYEWVKDETENLSGPSEMKTVFVKVPAEYMTVTETVVTELAKTEYYFQDAKYSSRGHVLKPKTIGLRNIPAVTNKLTRRVVKTPENIEERQVPIERKRGFRLVLKTPKKVVSVPADVEGVSVTVPVQKQPWKFMIKNPKGQIVHIFDDFNDLTAFMDAVKKNSNERPSLDDNGL